MSVRAYRINSIEKDPSFNTWHDEALMELLGKNCDFYGKDGESVFIAVDPELLKIAIKKIKYLDKDTKKNLQKDIKWAKGDTLFYQCY